MTTRVDFYQLETDEKQHFACRLIEKAYHSGLQVYVHLASKTECEAMDRLLWEFRPESFVPHGLRQAGATRTAPVELGWEDDCPAHSQMLINLTSGIPAFFSSFERVGEIVPHAEEEREAARRNFRYYKEQGCHLKYHQISGDKTAGS